MKLSELEIIGGVILGIVFIILIINYFWASPQNISFCGDGFCDEDEKTSCQLDCNWCGDGYCQDNEDCSLCPEDCGSCKADSFCGDDICNLGECEIGCTKDCSLSQCQDGECDLELGENCLISSVDCKCLDDERCDSSLKRCIKITCGNDICDDEETVLSCPNDCKEGYKEVLVDADKDYSIIFVHGHSPSEVEGYSPTSLEEFQDKLTEEGYEDMGIILPSDYPPKLTKGAWSGKKVSVITTYYADKYDQFGAVVGPDDNQHISVYAQRLRDVVEVVKHNAGKNKVIIIAHSMGGLVSREYIKNYEGINSVDKLVTIGTPNHGTYGYIALGCGNPLLTTLFGEGTRNPTPECDDMEAGSEFLTALNSNDETPGNIDYLTIIGLHENYTSCPSNEKWDGVICSSSVRLNGAENFEYTPPQDYEGSLHRDLVYPSKVPEVYDKIISFIKTS